MKFNRTKSPFTSTSLTSFRLQSSADTATRPRLWGARRKAELSSFASPLRCSKQQNSRKNPEFSGFYWVFQPKKQTNTGKKAWVLRFYPWFFFGKSLWSFMGFLCFVACIFHEWCFCSGLAWVANARVVSKGLVKQGNALGFGMKSYKPGDLRMSRIRPSLVRLWFPVSFINGPTTPNTTR